MTVEKILGDLFQSACLACVFKLTAAHPVFRIIFRCYFAKDFTPTPYKLSTYLMMTTNKLVIWEDVIHRTEETTVEVNIVERLISIN